MGSNAGQSRRRTALLSILVVAALGVGAAQSQAVTVKEFRPGLFGSEGQLGQIVAGPDGNLWFTAQDFPSRPSGSIIRMTPRGARDVFVEHGEGVGGPITTGPDGNLWFTGSDGGGGTTLGRVTLDGVISPIILGLGHSGAPAITAGPDGNLWEAVSGHGSQGSIFRATTEGVVTEFGVSAHLLGGITLGPDGNLWFTEGSEYPEEGQIGRITPQGAVTQFATGNMFVDRGLHGIASGPDGNLWFTNEAGEVGSITPSGVVTKFSTGIAPDARPYEIAAGPDGNLWFTEPGTKSIGRITPAGVVTEFSEGITGEPRGITAGPGNSLWFTERPGRIGRVILSPPAVVTKRASSINETSATITAEVNPNGHTVSDCRFEYGISQSYGSSAPCASLPGSGASPVKVTAPIGGLAAHTTYHFRIVATNPEGTGYGSDATLKTPGHRRRDQETSGL
jgi:streptogramin lyase